MKIILFCDRQVGESIAQWLINNYLADLVAVITIEKNATYSLARAKGIPSLIYESNSKLLTALEQLPRATFGVLAWWPKLISAELMALTDKGFINTHPSLLPYGRGKHPNFWALVEQTPFGVSLHYVETGIDSGDIIAQRTIPYDWEDTRETLYRKACQGIIELFKDTYPKLRTGEFPRMKQDPSKGKLHYAREIDAASRIDLDKVYLARDLLNLLRARTFVGHPACFFEDGGEVYEVRVSIRRKKE